jgi:hypothetical protein
MSTRGHEHRHHGHGEHPSDPSGGGHEHHHATDFRRRFWISPILSVDDLDPALEHDVLSA